MKILVFPHDLEIGGSQINAIEIAAAVQQRGHEVVMFGKRGALNARISELGLEFVESPRPSHRPTPAIVGALKQLVRSRNFDVLHGYEWPPTLECVLAARKTRAVAVCTVMSMAVAPFIPKHLPLMVGTANILAAEQNFGRTRAELMEPPVDLAHNNPGIDVGVEAFRRQWGLESSSFIVSTVTRLAVELKLEGVLSAIEAVGRVAHQIPVQYLIAGSGPARNIVEAAAKELNQGIGRRVVVLVGQLDDPRPAYATADLVLGMGGSALRAMSFAKPLVVQGEQGFWELLTPESLPLFLQQGWFGTGPATETGAGRLAGLLVEIHRNPDRRRELSAFGLATVTRRFSLARAAELQEACYGRAMQERVEVQLRNNLGAAGRFVAHEVAQHARQLRGCAAEDDFNAPRPGQRQATMQRLLKGVRG
ncbi:glycosyl transferase family 1 [Arthrobacter sp. SLBN-100]|uniref:glycosyltransferase n=1 Tax=Arthrobacter sp. SLBN-100 TaxID=2768450 RepID=UPI0011526129|nr:glycosyltransferase [Arthrobacter sp. SLBN-100]TQJ68622.1 glycosyl transferase family 1 [Arthrobacter sp. SLBN-100]